MKEKGLDTRTLYAALDQKRQSDELSWRQVAQEAGVGPSTLTRLGQGKRPDVDGFAALVKWLGQSADDFLKPKTIDKDAEKVDTMAVISTHLRSSKNLSPESVEALEDIIRAAYKGLKNS